MVQEIHEISTPPTPADPPSEFEQKAAKVWSDLAQAVPQLNILSGQLVAIGDAVDAAAEDAAIASQLAEGHKSDAQDAALAAGGFVDAASSSASAAASERGLAETARLGAQDFAQAAATSAATAENRVPMTGSTGAALLPEGSDAQRPATGSIPAGVFLMRGNTQDPADNKPEFWDRVAAAWKVLADRAWVKAITDALGLRLSTLESRPITVAAANFSCNASISIRSSFGISSITRESAGVMTVNFSTPQPDGNYLVFCGGSAANGRFTRVQETSATNSAPTLKTTAQVRLMHAADFAQPLDCSEINVQIVRIQP